METMTLPYDDWTFALRHAREFQYGNHPYPGPTGKRITDIEVVYNQFTITFEDGSQRKFEVEGGS